MLPLLLLLGATLPAHAQPPDTAEVLLPAAAVRRALSVAPSLDAQRRATQQARRDVGAGAYGFAPDLEVQASYTRLSDIDLPPFSIGDIELDSPFPVLLNNYNVSVGLTWPVSDLFFSMIPAHKARLDAVALQQATLDVERNQVAHNTLDAYLQLARVRAGLDVAASGVTVLEAHEAQLADLFTAGLATKADLLNVSAELAAARAQHQELLGLSGVAEAHLSSLLQLDGPLVVASPAYLVSEGPEDPLDTLVAVALDTRPEVQTLESLIDVHRHTAAAQRGAALPHLAVVGNTTYANPNQRMIPSTEEFVGTWDATIALSWSPGATVQAANASSQAKTKEAAARADLEALTRGVRVQVASALSERRAADLMVTASATQVQAAQAAFAAQKDLLAAGLATPAEALTTESSARQAQYAALDARVDLLQADMELRYALGTLLDSLPEFAP